MKFNFIFEKTNKWRELFLKKCVYIGEPYGYRGGPLGKPFLSKPLLHGFIKGLFYRPPEYQYGPDEIPFIFYSWLFGTGPFK